MLIAPMAEVMIHPRLEGHKNSGPIGIGIEMLMNSIGGDDNDILRSPIMPHPIVYVVAPAL